MVNLHTFLTCAFALQHNSHRLATTQLHSFAVFGKANGQTEKRNQLAQELLDAAREVGQIGSLASEQQRDRMEKLADRLAPQTDPRPARYPLTGVHDLVYSAAPGGSSGRLFGNVAGKVTQTFVDADTFVNAVSLGPLTFALEAGREVVNDKAIRVSFRETTVSLFGKAVLQKESGNGGRWECVFVGKVQDSDGNTKLLRVMRTPSLFVLTKLLHDE